MAEQVPLFNDLMSDIDKVASGSYDEIKKGQMALASVSQQPSKKAELRKAIATLGDQLDLPLAQRSAGRGAAVQVKVNQVVAPQIATHIDAGKSAEEAVRLFRQSEAGKSLGQIGSKHRGVLADVFAEFTTPKTDPDFGTADARRFSSTPAKGPLEQRVPGTAQNTAMRRRLSALRESGQLTAEEFFLLDRELEKMKGVDPQDRPTNPFAEDPEVSRRTSAGTRSAADVAGEARPTSPGARSATAVAEEARPTSPGGMAAEDIADAARPTDIDLGGQAFDMPDPKDEGLRLTDPDAGVSQRALEAREGRATDPGDRLRRAQQRSLEFVEGRTTDPGDALTRARQKLRRIDPEFAKMTDPFMPGDRPFNITDVSPDETARRVAVRKAEILKEGQKVMKEVKARDAERRFLRGETDDLAKGIGTGVQKAAEGSASKVKIGSAGKSLAQNIIDSRLGREVAETAGDLTLALGLSDIKTSPLIVAKSIAYSPAARIAGATLSGVGLALDAYEIYKAMESLNKSAGVAKAGDLDSIVNEFEATKRITRGQRAPVIKPIGEQGGDFDVKIAADLFSQTPGVKEELIKRGLISPESARVVDEYITSTVMADPKKVENLIVEGTVKTRAAKPQESPFSTEEFPESPVKPDKPSVSARPPAAEAPTAQPAEATAAQSPVDAYSAKKEGLTDKATQRQAAARQPGVLRVGSRGSAVGDLQTKLLALDQSEAMIKDRFGGRSLFDLGTTGAEGIGIDNVYGTKTRDAVRAFQKMAGITVDGRAGPETMKALDKAIEATKLARQEQMRQNREIAAAADDASAAPAVPKPTEFTRVDESVFTDENIDEAVGDIVKVSPPASDRRRPTQNTQAYLDLELDEEPRRSAFPMPRRSRRNRQ